MKTLEHIHLEGYKSIREMDLDLNALNVLIGPNGAGKSNLISIFELVNQMVQGKLNTYVGTAGGADTLLYFGRKTTEAIQLELMFATHGENLHNGYRCTWQPSREDRFIFSNESVAFHNAKHYNKPLWEGLGEGHAESQLLDTPGIARYVLRAMRSWRVYHFHDTSESAKIKATGDHHH